ncbi:MAG: hypothetical protein WD226_12065 [Planctomycetota bacterium]
MLRLSASFVLFLTSAASAQSGLVFAVSQTETLLDGAGGNAANAELRPSELAHVVPNLVFDSARPFLSDDAQWVFLGDFDADGTFVDDGLLGPGGAIDCVFVPRFGALAGASDPRDVFISRTSPTDLGASLRDGDVYRYSTQGSLEVFLNEVDLAAGLAGVSDFDLDALAQSPAGDLFFSVSDDTLGTLGTDGSIFYVPAASVLYGPGDIVLGVAPNSAVEIARESDVATWIQQSGMKSADGTAPSTADIDLSALELDPFGGAWVSPVDGQPYPNLWFAWDAPSSDAAVLSTAGGGSVANAGSAFLSSTSSTTGTALGLLPGLDGVGGLAGLALYDALPPIVLENYPTSVFGASTPLFTRQEVSGVTPGGAAFFFWNSVSNAPGSVAPATSLPALFGGQLFGDVGVHLYGATFADAAGYARVSSSLPPHVSGSNLHLIVQSFDLGSFSFSTPAPLDF